MGEKTYSKGVGASSFSLYSDLTTQIKTHTGDKPYCCKVCGSYYSMFLETRCFSFYCNLRYLVSYFHLSNVIYRLLVGTRPGLT